jgi:hypothetical protein
MKTNLIEFKTPQEFIMWLMNNEGKELCDSYGRKWKYEKYFFYFKNIGLNDAYEKGIECLHLYQTVCEKDLKDRDKKVERMYSEEDMREALFHSLYAPKTDGYIEKTIDERVRETRAKFKNK